MTLFSGTNDPLYLNYMGSDVGLRKTDTQIPFNLQHPRMFRQVICI